jgi:hypothetical protein
MRRKITGILVVFFGFGIIFSSNISTFLTESQYLEDNSINKKTDDIPQKDKPDTDKDKDNEIVIALIRINPQSLNLKSKGRKITVFIELPAKYNVEDIDLRTVTLNNEIFAEEKPTEFNDFNDNSITDLMVKFDRSSIINLLRKQELCEVNVSGYLSTNVQFQGSCEIAVR